MIKTTEDRAAWAGVLIFVGWTMGPVLGHWSTAVLGPFGGIDAMLQLGLVQWTASHWWQPHLWLNLPIFYPLPGMLGCMDSLLGQAWLVWPVHLLFHPSFASLYNLAFLGSLLWAAVGMATLWRATTGTWKGAGIAALALVGAPYTTAQLGHLNQLPPPFVLFCLAAVAAALRRQELGRPARGLWWLVGGCLVLQAAWGWYGLAYALVGTVVLKGIWLWRLARSRQHLRPHLLTTVKGAWLPTLLALALVYLLAQPQLQLGRRYPQFTRSQGEVRLGSADIQHLVNRGAYRGRISDWLGHGAQGQARYLDWARQTLHPGWLALLLAVYGWSRRRRLEAEQAATGSALLVVGLVGLVLAFGDSVGVPGTHVRLPLPLEWLRSIAPPFRAFRGAWRFAWLMTIAVAWWAAQGAEFLAALPGWHRRLAPGALIVMIGMSLPMGVPAVAVPTLSTPAASGSRPTGPVLTLPAPVNEYAEDQTEALWLARAQALEQRVTGGATGWVPPEIIAFRERLHGCEAGTENVGVFLAAMRKSGFSWAEIALRPGDEQRTDFWRAALTAAGAVAVNDDDSSGYATYCLDPQASSNVSEP